MLLRTRKVALGLKVICILSVTATYAILGALSTKIDQKPPEFEGNKNLKKENLQEF